MTKKIAVLLMVVGCMAVGSMSFAANPFVGYWALNLPGGGAGWLGVTEQLDANGQPYLDAAILWGGGHPLQVSSAFMDNDGNLMLTRLFTVNRGKKGSLRSVLDDGSFVRANYSAPEARNREHVMTELLTARLEDQDTLSLTRFIPPRTLKQQLRVEQFSGKRLPPLPPRPDLKKVRFGEPIQLFNGRNLKGWTLTNPKSVNGWFVKNGVLINDPKQEKGKPHIPYGNLRTEQEFEDFNLKLEVKVLPGGNSGIYLRGIYEVQVADTYGQPLHPRHMGGLYGRITPQVLAEKPAGEWQFFDITLCNRHVTVNLNGKKIIDNEPLFGCTGGALWSDVTRPGPIYLQGDHTGVEYRNIVLTPIVK